ncbi:MAG: hypothetical protein V7K77_01975, partial [Nostoc sp.]|uniref:hypothetical protein n=1 Tax=Nostoc sp. TaxID=1180 RepID=UPI002FF57C06
MKKTNVKLIAAVVLLSVLGGPAQAQFNLNESWTQNPYYGSRGTFFADVTGDGRADAIVVNDDKITVRRSNG